MGRHYALTHTNTQTGAGENDCLRRYSVVRFSTSTELNGAAFVLHPETIHSHVPRDYYKWCTIPAVPALKFRPRKQRHPSPQSWASCCPESRPDHPERLVREVCDGHQPEAGEGPGDRRDRAPAVHGQGLQALPHWSLQGVCVCDWRMCV